MLENSKTGRDFIQTHGIPTARGIEHEITTLKCQDKEDLRCGAAKGRSTLLVYDAAIIDFQYAYNLKQSKSIYIITAWKDNFAPMTTIPREIDRTKPANTLIISDEIICFNNPPVVWRHITANCPDSNEIYITLTNQMTLSPGALNQCRRLRWGIEKAFNQQEQKLDEPKAWSASEEGKRMENARAAGRHLPVELYQAPYRPSEVSLQFIRWLRISLTRPACYRRAIEQLRPLMLTYL